MRNAECGVKRFYLLGENIQGSLSPFIHSIIYNELGLKAEYSLFSPSSDVLKIGQLPTDFDGLNVTIPYKEAILPLLERDESGCKSVNTVLKTSSGLVGHSTDGEGFILDANRLDLDLSDVLVVGTGGAARSICFSLKQKGSRVAVFSRDENRGKAFASSLGVELAERGKTYSLVINCTPAFLAVDFFCAKGYYDLKYHGGDGLGMLIYQAILSDCLFFDRQIDLEIFDLIYRNIKEKQ